MLKTWCLMITLAGLTVPGALAEMYQCRTPDGKVIITDRKIFLSDDCQQLRETPEANTFESESRPGNVAEESAPDVKQAATTPASKPMQHEATELAQRYREAVQQRYHGSYASEKRQAMQQIEELKKQKQQMLRQLPGSGLTDSERQAIRGILDEIP